MTLFFLLFIIFSLMIFLFAISNDFASKNKFSGFLFVFFTVGLSFSLAFSIVQLLYNYDGKYHKDLKVNSQSQVYEYDNQGIQVYYENSSGEIIDIPINNGNYKIVIDNNIKNPTLTKNCDNNNCSNIKILTITQEQQDNAVEGIDTIVFDTVKPQPEQYRGSNN